MKIYRGTGDRGYTSFFIGKHVPLCHGLLQAYGDLNELNSFLGLPACRLAPEKFNSDCLFIPASYCNVMSGSTDVVWCRPKKLKPATHVVLRCEACRKIDGKPVPGKKG